MANYRSDQSQNDHKQKQNINAASGKITQVGRDFTQTTNTRINLWVSAVFVFAVGASVLVSLFGEQIPDLEIQLEESLPAEIFNKSTDYQ